MATVEMVGLGADRRTGDRRALLHEATAADAVGFSFTGGDRARTETMLCEAQAAAYYARTAVAHAIAAGKTAENALREAKAACVAAERAAHLATLAISGATS